MVLDMTTEQTRHLVGAIRMGTALFLGFTGFLAWLLWMRRLSTLEQWGCVTILLTFWLSTAWLREHK